MTSYIYRIVYPNGTQDLKEYDTRLQAVRDLEYMSREDPGCAAGASIMAQELPRTDPRFYELAAIMNSLEAEYSLTVTRADDTDLGVTADHGYPRVVFDFDKVAWVVKEEDR